VYGFVLTFRPGRFKLVSVTSFEIVPFSGSQPPKSKAFEQAAAFARRGANGGQIAGHLKRE